MNKTELNNLVNDGKSLNEISSYFRKSYTSIRYWLKKYGLKTKWNGFLETKYTDDELLKIANSSNNYTHFLNQISHKDSGGAWYHYKNRLKRLGFDFTEYEKNTGGKITARKRNQEALKKKKRIRRKSLDAFLKHNNVEYKCSSCGINEWLGKRLLLAIHHKDENSTNNTLNNLCYLCPNCHNLAHYDENDKQRRTN